MLTHSYLTPSSSTPYFVMLPGALGCFRLDGLSTIPRSARTTNPTRRKRRRPGRETEPSKRRKPEERTDKTNDDLTGLAWIERGKSTPDLGEKQNRDPDQRRKERDEGGYPEINLAPRKDHNTQKTRTNETRVTGIIDVCQ